MAPSFAFLTHHSFRRGASTQLTAVPESKAARLASDMGAIPSKVSTTVTETATSRKPRPRSSSLNLLKRSRTPSGNTAVRTSAASQPVPIVENTSVAGDCTRIEYTKTSIEHHPDSETTIKLPRDSVHSSKSSKDGNDDDSISDASSTATATRLNCMSKDQNEVTTGQPEETPEISTPIPVPPPRTPRITLPTPPFLPEDSPTKYGLRIAHTPSPDRSLTEAQRKKMTGAGLFVHAANQQKSSAPFLTPDQAKSGALDPNHLFVQSSPSLPLSEKPHSDDEHSNSLPIRKLRLTNPFKEAPQENVAHALPLKRSQRACFRDHDFWHRLGQNSQHPVACAVCDGYEAPGDDFMTCSWCELHVCGECYAVFVKGGMMALMGRQKRR